MPSQHHFCHKIIITRPPSISGVIRVTRVSKASRALNCLIEETQNLEALLKLITSQVQHFDAFHTATSIFRLAKLCKRDHRLFDLDMIRTLVSTARKNLAQMNSKQLSNLARSFDVLNIRDDNMLNELAKAAIEKMAEANARDLSTIAKAFATLGLRHDKLMSAGAERWSQIQPLLNNPNNTMPYNFTLQDLATTAWSAAVFFDERHLPLISAMFARLRYFTTYDEASVHQLASVHERLQLAGKTIEIPPSLSQNIPVVLRKVNLARYTITNVHELRANA